MTYRDFQYDTMAATEAAFQVARNPSTAFNVSPSPTVDSMLHCGGNDSDTCYVNFARFVHMMDLIAVPIIIAIGVVGNVVSCLVFTCTYLRRVSSSVYLAALAVVDTVYLCVLFFSWLVDVGIQVYS